MSLNLYHPKAYALIWLVGMGLIIWLALVNWQRNWLETSFLALLPKVEQQPAVAKAIAQHQQLLSHKLIYLTGADTPEQAINLAEDLKRLLNASQLFSELQLQLPQQHYQQRYQQLFPYRYQLLDPATRLQLERDPRQISAENLQRLNNPFSALQTLGLEQDPLLLYNRYFSSLNTVPLNIQQGVVVLAGAGRFWALLVAEYQDQSMKLDQLEQLLAVTRNSESYLLAKGAELLASGMPLFTAYGAETASQEINTIGLGSTLGVVILLLLSFSSPRPLLLSALAIASGLLAGWALSVVWLGKLHILTLVFGASLIGVVVDYALHFFCDGLGLAQWTPRKGLTYVLPGIAFGLLTSLLGYAGLGFSAFPGLQEIALFSSLGLIVSWLTVVMLFPWLLQGFSFPQHPPILAWVAIWEQHWPRWCWRHRKVLAASLVCLISAGLWQLEAKDDVRLLQSAPPALLAADAKIRNLLPLSRDSQFFLVSGLTLADFYRNEQALSLKLSHLQQIGALKHFDAISAVWPDQIAQRQNYQLLKQHLYDNGLLAQSMTTLGFSQSAIQSELQHFKTAEGLSIALEDWLVGDTAKQGLWLGCDEQHCQGIVAVSGIQNLQALAALDNSDSLQWVDPVAQMSAVFQRYRLQVSYLLLLVNTLLLAGLCWRLGWQHGLRIMAVPVVAMLAALASLGWLKDLFSLFNLFALLLVLEIGLDYAIFFYMAGQDSDPSEKRSSTALAVSLSALTTLLAYGLLALCSTTIVHAFGLTLLIGVSMAFLLAPLLG